MEEILKNYYEDNARKLRGLVDRILLKFGGLSDMDMDDFYSLANEVFTDAIRRYDGSGDFDGFLYSCLLNRVKTEITRRNREKRRAERMSVSIDMPVGEEDDETLGDGIAGSFDVEREVLGKEEEGYSRRMVRYLERLSGLQKTVLEMSAVGYSPGEIRTQLQINEKQLADCNAAIHSYRNVSVLL